MKLEKVERSPVLDKVFRAISYLKILQDFCHEFLKLFYLYLFIYLFIYFVNSCIDNHGVKQSKILNESLFIHT